MKKQIAIILSILLTSAVVFGVASRKSRFDEFIGGTFTGTTSTMTTVNGGNLRMSGNSVISTDTDGNININPDGNGLSILTDLTATTVPYLGSSKELLSSSVNPTELGQLATIDSTTVSAGQWGYLGALDQALATTDSPDFGSATISSTQWGYLGGSDQAVKTTDTPTFDGVTLTNPMTLSHETTPSNPSSGNVKIYPKNDDTLYVLNSAGTETAIGAGGEGGGLDAFYTETMETTVVADFTSGNNATFDNGGTLGGALADETTSPIRGDSSFKYTMNATAASSDNDWVKSPTITLDSKQKGNIIGLTFYYNYDGDDDDVRIICWDDTNNANMAVDTAYIKNTSTDLRTSASCNVLSTTSTIAWGIQTITGNSSKVLIIDDIEISTNPFVYKDLLDPDASIAGAGNGGTVITANTTNIDFTEVTDVDGLWNGTQFTADQNGTYTVIGTVITTAAQAASMYAYIDATQDKPIGNYPTATTIKQFNIEVDLTSGEVLSFRSDTGFTLSNTTDHYISIKRKPTSTENIIGYNSKNAVSSMVRLQAGNGHGSTNTVIRRFSNTIVSQGSAITYADSSTLGGTFTINEAGVYHVGYSDTRGAGACAFGLSLNSSQLTTSVASITAADKLLYVVNPGATEVAAAPWSGPLSVGDVIRAHTNNACDSTSTDVTFTISKIGKDDLLGVPTRGLIANAPNLRIVSATLTDTGTPAIDQQDGTWIDTIADDGTGDYNLNITSGIFSVKPNCTCANSDSNNVNCNLDSVTTTDIGVNIRRLDTGAPLDGGFSIICIGAQ